MFNPARCCQCGVCLAACPASALSSSWNQDTGSFDIVIDEESCTTCGLCVACCPAGTLPGDTINQGQLQGAKGLYLGHASDKQVRFMGSTGGVARTLLMSVLADNKVDAVYSLYKDTADDTEAYGRYLTTVPANEKIPSSLYRPILWGKGVLDIQPTWKRILLIGVPCQIKSAKKLLAKKFPKLEVSAVALICRQQKNAFYTDYVKMILGTPQIAKEKITYRGGGWPGKLGVLGAAGDFPGFMASGEAFGNNLWRVAGCKYCSDCLGVEVADMTLADPWNFIAETEDPVGSNIVMVWSDTGMRMLEQSREMIEKKKIPYDVVEKILAFSIINKKKDEIQCRQGRQKSTIKIMQFWLREKKIQWLESLLLSRKHDSVFVKIACKLLKRLG